MIEVLIVDDSPEYCELLKTILDLDPEIFPVGEANNGYDALEFCEILLPDVILMDLMMPECDGIKGTIIIKNKFPDVKIIVMTSIENEGNLKKALEVGADGYFLKGIETPKLREAIKNVMNGVTILIRKSLFRNHLINRIKLISIIPTDKEIHSQCFGLPGLKRSVVPGFDPAFSVLLALGTASADLD